MIEGTLFMTKQTCPVVSVILALTLSAAGCQGDKPVPTERPAAEPLGPRLEAAATTYDAGETDFSQARDYSFTIRNTGDQPLRLSVISKSCTCTAVEAPAEPIAPGKEGKVVLRWTPIPGQVGPFSESAELRTNDPRQPTLQLVARALISPQVRIWPEDMSYVDLGTVNPEKPAEKDVKVFSTRLENFDLKATMSHPGIRVAQEKLPPDSPVGEARARSGYVLTLTTTGDLPQGYVRETLTLTVKVQGQEPRVITLPVYAQVDNSILQVTPPEATFRARNLADGDRVKVLAQFLVPAKGQTLAISRCEPAFLTCGQPRPTGKPGLWQFEVSIPPGNEAAMKFQPDQFFEGQVVLKTTTPDREIPIRVKWAPGK